MGEPAPWGTRARRTAREDARALARLLAQPGARLRVLQGLRGRRELATPEKHALVLLLVLATMAVWLAGTAALRVLAPGLAQPWDLAWGLAGVAYVTTVGLPIPFEPALLAAKEGSGQVVAVLATAVAKTAGAATVFFLGGRMRQKLKAWEHRWRWVGTFLNATERFARRWSYAAFAAMMAAPFFPDTVPVYLFAVMNLKLAPFLAASFVGIAVRATLIVLFGRLI